MAKKTRWVKHLSKIPATTWLTASQMADIMRPYVEIKPLSLSQRLKGAVAVNAGIQSRSPIYESKEFSIYSHDSLIAYLLN